ncbi:uncharacterized protein BO96DRAFT_443326 [Aspergillus niger CBS 101883]|uniref:uncharacterized protein n=1 Tax=Aspergillus lacticoffeatus (strain CBS 101883) TaxID=1450533 RepID=UPI000D7F3CF0|nr:uncharacterized protein BO96DRAFT_443326 [Aspergillus niger CBS 101883]PYH60289.1 hypothetical protein BO96DRAFT_443326 [Aspergillus niger CBS 101883]
MSAGHPKYSLISSEVHELELKVLPPTASVRAITIDGGGVRAIIPLRFLGYM